MVAGSSRSGTVDHRLSTGSPQGFLVLPAHVKSNCKTFGASVNCIEVCGNRPIASRPRRRTACSVVIF